MKQRDLVYAVLRTLEDITVIAAAHVRCVESACLSRSTTAHGEQMAEREEAARLTKDKLMKYHHPCRMPPTRRGR